MTLSPDFLGIQIVKEVLQTPTPMTKTVSRETPHVNAISLPLPKHTRPTLLPAALSQCRAPTVLAAWRDRFAPVASLHMVPSSRTSLP